MSTLIKRSLRAALPYVLVIVVGTAIVTAGSAYLDYTDELNTAKAEAEQWKEHTDALLSRGAWKCTDYQKNGGRCTYRFVPNSRDAMQRIMAKVRR
jgi:hypothetical protein